MLPARLNVGNSVFVVPGLPVVPAASSSPPAIVSNASSEWILLGALLTAFLATTLRRSWLSLEAVFRGRAKVPRRATREPAAAAVAATTGTTTTTAVATTTTAVATTAWSTPAAAVATTPGATAAASVT